VAGAVNLYAAPFPSIGEGARFRSRVNSNLKSRPDPSPGKGRIRSVANAQTYRLRCAAGLDAEGILAIYAPIVRETSISFELEPPSPEQMRERIESTIQRFPWLVCESERGIEGYAYASRHRERAAYQWSVDVSVYVAADARRNGVGRSLYATLLGMLGDLGYRSALAGIALPNPASVGLHEAMGFQPIGIYQNIGYKLGAWHDVGWWQLKLREYRDEPDPPRRMADYAGTARMRERLGE
jgi:L-amino acid N-acyltransferase YncA